MLTCQLSQPSRAQYGSECATRTKSSSVTQSPEPASQLCARLGSTCGGSACC